MTLRYPAWMQDLARSVGFDVSPDPDQPGRYQWVRREAGQVVEGCEMSLPTEAAAWNALLADLVETVMADQDLSSEDWDGLGPDQVRARVEATYASA